MQSDHPDFRLDGYRHASFKSQTAFDVTFDVTGNSLTMLADHHSENGLDSYFIFHDGTAIYGIPGEDQIIALHIIRLPDLGLYDFRTVTLPLPAMAQSWLIARGCPPQAIGLREGVGTAPADEITRRPEQRLMHDGDHFAHIHSYTGEDPPDVTVLLRALEDSPARFRILLETTDLQAWTHRLREGGFATYPEAQAWLTAFWTGEEVQLPPMPSASNAKTSGPAAPPAASPPHRPRR